MKSLEHPPFTAAAALRRPFNWPGRPSVGTPDTGIRTLDVRFVPARPEIIPVRRAPIPEDRP